MSIAHTKTKRPTGYETEHSSYENENENENFCKEDDGAHGAHDGM